MTLYANTDQAEHVFGGMFSILMEDEAFTRQLADADLSATLIHTSPDCVVHVSTDGVRLGDDAKAAPTDIMIKMSCDTAHSLWMGTLMMPTAIATRKVRIRGKVAKVIEFVPILQPAFDRYPQISADAGVGV
jgi:putative sterol carrier protein